MEAVNLIEHQQIEVNLTSSEYDLLRRSFSNQLEIWPSLEPGKYQIKANSYAGVIVLPTGKSIYIQPKIAIQTLFALLAKVYDPAQEVFSQEPQPYTSVMDLFDFIVSFFTSETEDLIARGLLRGYQSHLEDLQAIRGRLQIEKTITTHPGVYDKHWCTYRHFSIDVPENRILLWTVTLLRSWDFSDPDLFGRLRRIQKVLNDVQIAPFSREHLDQLEYHRLNESYKQALTLARLLLDSLSFSGSQGNEPFLAYIIDMDMLFQNYLTIILRETIESKGYSVIDTEKHTLDLGGIIKLIPDILIYKNSRPILIIDAKYKLSASQEDLYQMLAYCHAINLNKAILVHPANELAPSGIIYIKGAGEFCIEYNSLELCGDPQQLKENSKLLAAKILCSIEEQITENF